MKSLSITRTYFEIIFPWRSSRGELLKTIGMLCMPVPYRFTYSRGAGMRNTTSSDVVLGHIP